VLEQLKALFIGPLQVVQNEHEWLIGGRAE